ncbi:MAG: hydroxymethylbilane synthase [Acidimicrobiaceae bacterium]|nr:hydroxymethylbilane synthase [Acidimicrobiia bacterium]MCY4495299.1 hydroxymethylbilane synthase [Acidimicrobiaceae bacterium]
MLAATRQSPLALWQTRHVASLLVSAGVADRVEELVVSTSGDRRRNTPIQAMGGKGVFSKEVQQAVLDGRADIAVHSAKDLTSVTPDGLVLASVPQRGDSRDALVGTRLGDLPEGARVATGSVRRRAQLAWHRADLVFSDLRGNIATRLGKARQFDAIVMAMAAVERLELDVEVLDPLDHGVMVPQVAQGALAIECRADDHDTLAALGAIEDPAARRVVDTERAFLAELGGDCTLPAGAIAVLRDAADTDGDGDSDGSIELVAMLASLDGRTLLRQQRRGSDPDFLGRSTARSLLDDSGGHALLAEARRAGSA